MLNRPTFGGHIIRGSVFLYHCAIQSISDIISSGVLPSVSTVAICLIIAAVVSHNAEKIYTSGVLVFAVVILHNLLGYAGGFGLGKLLKMPPEKVKALSIEVGMQNSGLATSLAGTAFSGLAMATVPGAVFSVWHNISGAILAGFYRRWKNSGEPKK